MCTAYDVYPNWKSETSSLSLMLIHAASVSLPLLSYFGKMWYSVFESSILLSKHLEKGEKNMHTIWFQKYNDEKRGKG